MLIEAMAFWLSQGYVLRVDLMIIMHNMSSKRWLNKVLVSFPISLYSPFIFLYAQESLNSIMSKFSAT